MLKSKMLLVLDDNFSPLFKTKWFPLWKYKGYTHNYISESSRFSQRKFTTQDKRNSTLQDGGGGAKREKEREAELKHEEWRHFVMPFCFYTESANRRSRRIADQVWRNIYSFPEPWVTDVFQWPPAPMTCAQSTNDLLSGLWSLNAKNITS